MLNIEIERRVIFDREFPFDIINIPSRKLRILDGGKVSYCIVNKDFDRMGLCLGKDLQKYLGTVYENPNWSVKTGEYFIKVPKDEFRWIDLL